MSRSAFASTWVRNRAEPEIVIDKLHEFKMNVIVDMSVGSYDYKHTFWNYLLPYYLRNQLPMLRVFHSSGSRQTYTITMGLYDISLFDVFVLLRWQSFFSDIWGSQAIQISQYQDSVCPSRVFLHRLSVSHTATQWYSNSNTAREKKRASVSFSSGFSQMGRFSWGFL